jgi:energy-coupling factor transport system permease protein
VSLSTNPLLGLLMGLSVTAVVVLRRGNDPWARSVAFYFALAGFVLVMRLVFQIVLGVPQGDTVLFSLPQIPLPAWAAGVRIGGPVTAEALAATLYDTLRLALMLLCLGAANSLANPRRALRTVPAALYEASVAVVVALSVAPQLVESTQRVRRARRLRGGRERGWRAVLAVVIPVLTDAIDRSLALAAGMESRGFGRTRGASGGPVLALATAASLSVTIFGGYLLLSGHAAVNWAVALLVIGVGATLWCLRQTGRGLRVTRHRPDPWTPLDTALVGLGALSVAGTVWLAWTAPSVANPPTLPLAWPGVHPAMLLALAGAIAPLLVVPDPLREQVATS